MSGSAPAHVVSPSTLCRQIRGGDVRAALEFVKRYPQDDLTDLIRVVHLDGTIPSVASFDACCDAFDAHARMRAKRELAAA